MPREITDENNYSTKLIKLVPADFIAGYLVIDKAIPAGSIRKPALTIATLIVLVLLFLTLRFVHGIKSWPQILVTCTAFIIWIYSTGGIFVEYDYYYGSIASVLLVLWTFVLPLFKFQAQP
jgi:hypothetical protein